jgi:hypothetical protein
MSEHHPPSPPSPERAHDAADLRALLDAAPHVEDAGFSERVMRALPRRRRARGSPYAIVPAFTVLACGLAYALGAGTHAAAPPANHHGLSQLLSMSSIGIALALVLVAVGAMVPAEE